MVDYCTSEDVEDVLRLTLAESLDALIARCITNGSCLVDSFLKVKSLLVPSVVPQLVVETAARFAVGSLGELAIQLELGLFGLRQRGSWMFTLKLNLNYTWGESS